MAPSSSKCDVIRELLNDRLDHRLAATHAPEVDAHLLTCRECVEYERHLCDMRRSLQTIPRIPAPPGRVSAGVRRRLDRRGLMLRGRASLWVSGLAAAALLFVVAAVRDQAGSPSANPAGVGAVPESLEGLADSQIPEAEESMRSPDSQQNTVASEPEASDTARTAVANSPAPETQDPSGVPETVESEAGEPAIGTSTSSVGSPALPSAVTAAVLRASHVANAIDSTEEDAPPASEAPADAEKQR